MLETVYMYVWPIGLVTLFLCVAFILNYPRYLERAMARKKERRVIADILSAALQDACHKELITARQWHKYNKKLALALKLPDMLGRRPNLQWLTKQAIINRLSLARVDIRAGLDKIRRNKPKSKIPTGKRRPLP